MDRQARGSLTGKAELVSMCGSDHVVVCCSIMGEGEELGIVPRFANELFARVEGTSNSKVSPSCSQLVLNKVMSMIDECRTR